MEIAFLALRVLLAAALYGFLAWALWLLWNSLRLQSQKLSTAQVPSIIMALLDDEEQVFRFNRREVIIGRQPGSDLRLSDSTISARHARLLYHHGQWWAEDLRSKNGTYLNEAQVSIPQVLASGDALRCGGVILQIEIAGGRLGDDVTQLEGII